MRSRFPAILILLFSFVSVSAQQYDWALPVGGISNDQGNAIATDAQGNVYLAGCYYYTVDADPGPGIATLTSPGGNQSALVAKYDSSGNYLWAFRLGGAGSNTAMSVTADNNSNIYVTGMFSGTADFDPGAGTASLTAASSNGSIFVASYDANGNYRWAFGVNGTNGGMGRSVKVDQQGNLFVTGQFSGTSDFDPGAGVVNLTTSPTFFTDAFVASYSVNGQFQWAFKVGGSYNDWAYSIALDSASNIYITGKFRSTTDFNPGPATANLNGVGTADIFVASYDSSGNYRWAIKMGGYDGDEGLYVSVSNNQCIYVTGLFRDSADFDPGPGTDILHSVGGANDADIFVGKYTLNGNYVRAFSFGSSDYEWAWGVEADSTGNIFVTGYVRGTTDFDPGPGTFMHTIASGNVDAFLAQYDSTGYFRNAFAISSLGSETGFGVIAAPKCIYMTGSFSNSPDFDPGINSAPMTAVAYSDIFISRYVRCTRPDVPSLVANIDSVCAGQPVTLSLTSGNLNDAAQWYWYEGDCGGARIDSGVTTTVTPSVTTTYYCRGEGGCGGYGYCNAITVNVRNTPQLIVGAADDTICEGDHDTLFVSGADNFLWNFGGVSAIEPVLPSATTSYSVIGTNNNGCSDTASVNIIVYSLPVINATAANGTICQGITDTLFASGGNTYLWNFGGTNSSELVSPAVTTGYTVTGTDIHGCSQTASVTVQVNAQPAVMAAATNGFICQGQNDSLHVSGAGNYLWSFGGTDSMETVSPMSTTTYSVIGSDTNGCSDTASLTVVVYTLPSINATASDVEICAGTSDTLLVTGGSTYLWNFGGNDSVEEVSPLVTITYSVTGTDTNGCSASSSVNILVHALPSVTATAVHDTICLGDVDTLTVSGASSYAWNFGGSNSEEPVSPSATTMYSVTGTDSNGCADTSSVTVTVNGLPVVNATAINGNICAGESDTLVASGGINYAWSSGGTDSIEIISPAATTTYSVNVTDANGCSDMASVMVVVHALPVVTLDLSLIDTLCATMGGVTLNGGSPANGTYSGTGVSGNQFVPVTSGPGTFAVTYLYTDSLGCNSSATDSVFVDICTGLDEHENNLVSVYPNPCDHAITILFSEPGVEPAVVEIFNLQGQRVFVFSSVLQNSTGQLISIDVSELASGTYLLVVTTPSGIVNRRVVINHS